MLEGLAQSVIGAHIWALTGVNSCMWVRMQDAQARQDFVLDQMQKEAVKVGTAAMAMPGAGSSVMQDPSTVSWAFLTSFSLCLNAFVLWLKQHSNS